MKTPRIEVLAVNGKRIEQQLIIVEASIEYTIEKSADIVKISIQADKNWQFSEVFPPNCLFDVSYGWEEQTTGRRWILKEVHKNFRDKGKVIEIIGQDPLRLLLDQNQAPSKLWTLLFKPGSQALKASEIVQIIGMANGFDVSDVTTTPDTPAQPYQQGTMSDGEFIYYLASKNLDYKVWADWTIDGVKRLHFKPRSTPTSRPQFKYVYGNPETIERSIITFNTTEQFVKKDEVKQNSVSGTSDDACVLSLRSEFVTPLAVDTKSDINSTDIKTQGTFKVNDITQPEIKKIILNRGTEAKGIVVSNNRKIVSTIEEDLKTRQVKVVAQLQKEQEEFGEAKMTTFGNPEVVAGILVEVQGLDNEADGLWIVHEVTHQINSKSYMTDWVLKRNSTNAADAIPSGASNNNTADEQVLSLFSEVVK